MCGTTLIFLQIIFCGLSYGMESPQTVYKYPQNNQKDSVQRNLNLELSKITHQIQIGHDIELFCGNDSKLLSQSPTVWHYKACRHGLNQFSCSKAIETRDSRPWQQLKCSASNNNCGSSLMIANPTEKDSGLYRCSIYPLKSSLDKQVVKTYFLDVRNTTIPSPVIVDGPKNATTFTDSQVVMQCCVNSLIRPSITWFKRQDGRSVSSNGTTTNLIEYTDIHGVLHIYAQLESAGERLLSDGVYLSKLILNGVTERDAGFYVCVAVNYGGYKIQEAHLNVLDTSDDESDEPSTRSLLLLFLIPVGLALAPLTLWICYVLLKNGNDYVPVDKIIVP